MNAEQISLFKNLSDWDLNPDMYWDLHNDFDCLGIELSTGRIGLRFRSVSDRGFFLTMEFLDVDIACLRLAFDTPIAALTLDNLYRGRFEINDHLIEYDEQGRGYFYLEFYEGPTFELWATSVSVIPDVDVLRRCG